MSRYFSLTIADFMSAVVYRVHFIFIFITNILYIILLYFLWKAIYRWDDTLVLNGMTFNQAFLYLSMASSIFCLFQTYSEWGMSRLIIGGDVVIRLFRPIDLQLTMMFSDMGFVMSNLVAITIPSLLIILFIFKVHIIIGWNIIFFTISVLMAYLISFGISFIMGVISFYTQSIWGMFFAKEAIVLVLSGATVPVIFFPEAIRNVILLLPFQAIYNVPLTLLTSNDQNISKMIGLLGIQMFWGVLLFASGRLFYLKAVKNLTVNGG